MEKIEENNCEKALNFIDHFPLQFIYYKRHKNILIQFLEKFSNQSNSQ